MLPRKTAVYQEKHQQSIKNNNNTIFVKTNSTIIYILGLIIFLKIFFYKSQVKNI